MQICHLLRNSAERFNAAADMVCIEYSESIRSSGICSPCDRMEFNRLIKNKIAATGYESVTAVHTNITEGNNHVLRKLTA